jgi:chromosome segregation ATPase
VTEQTLRSTQRELDRQRGNDNGIIAAKVKAEEALRVTSHGEYEARKSLECAEREVTRLKAFCDKNEDHLFQARAAAIRTDAASAPASLAYMSQVANLQTEIERGKERLEDMTRLNSEWQEKANALERISSENIALAGKLQGCLSRVERRLSDLELEMSMSFTQLSHAVNDDISSISAAYDRMSTTTQELQLAVNHQRLQGSATNVLDRRRRHAATIAHLRDQEPKLRDMTQHVTRTEAERDAALQLVNQRGVALNEETSAPKETTCTTTRLSKSQSSLQQTLAGAEKDKKALAQRVVTFTERLHLLFTQTKTEQNARREMLRQAREGQQVLE